MQKMASVEYRKDLGLAVFEELPELGFVSDVHLDALHCLSRDLFHTLEGLGRRIDKVVDDNDAKAGLEQNHGTMCANEARAPGDHHGHVSERKLRLAVKSLSKKLNTHI